MTKFSSLLMTDEETLLVDSARGFLADASPVSAFRALRDTKRGYDPDLWKQMAGLGWAGILVPERLGGADMGHAAAGLLAQEMGKNLVASPFLSTAVIAATALRQVASARADQALRAIATGDLTYALAIDEGAKHAPDATEMHAKEVGNGFELTGAKTCAVDAGFADRLLVLARTSDHAMTVFDLPSDRAGIDIDRLDTVDARDAAEIRFNGVSVTGDEILGSVNNAMSVLRPALQAGQAALAAELTGLAAGAFGMTLAYLKERKQFGALIGSFQALQHRAAHLWAEQEITASAIMNAGRMLDNDPQNARLAVSLAKARACQTAKLAVIEGVQMHGGIGMTDAYDMGFFMKRARVATEWLGDYGYHAQIVAELRGF